MSLREEREGSPGVGFSLGIAPGGVDDVGLELVGAPVVGDVHELLVRDLEVRQYFFWRI